MYLTKSERRERSLVQRIAAGIEDSIPYEPTSEGWWGLVSSVEEDLFLAKMAGDMGWFASRYTSPEADEIVRLNTEPAPRMGRRETNDPIAFDMAAG